MARALNFIETASGASGVVIGLASIPSGADNAVIRFEAGTARWSETSGSWLSATAVPSGRGLVISGADPPFRIDGLSTFRFIPVGGAAAVNVLYYGYEGRMMTG